MREIYREADPDRLRRLTERAGHDVGKWSLMFQAAEDPAWVDWVAENAVACGAWSDDLDRARSVRLLELAGEPPF